MLKVFLSYASEDRALVHPYFRRFASAGLSPWMDVEALLPGQQWEGAIEKAFREAHVIILFMSPRSVDKRGFVQREANEAIQNLRMRRPDDIYAIPVMLEKCEVPFQIAGILQYIDAASPGAWEAVMKSLSVAAEQQKISIASGDEHGPFRVFTETLSDRVNGAPGHDLDLDFPRLVSSQLPKAAAQLSSLFAGRSAGIAAANRSTPWDQTPDLIEFDDQDEPEEFSWNRDGRWETFAVLNANENFFSLCYTVSWYGARAAHPNHHFETASFVINDDGLCAVKLADFFDDFAGGLASISEKCQQEIEREYWRRTGEAPDQSAREWIAGGCSKENHMNFEAFAARDDGLTFFFAPYAVGPYALSSFSVKVDYYDLLKLLRPGGPHTYAMGRVTEQKSGRAPRLT